MWWLVKIKDFYFNFKIVFKIFMDTNKKLN